MKRSFTVLGLAAIVLFSACDSRDLADVVEPSFDKVVAPCPAMEAPISAGSTLTKQDLVDYYLYPGIGQLFDTRNAQKAARGHIDNIVKELCQSPASPDYAAAMGHVNSFVQQVDGQPDDKLAQNAQLAADLVNWAILLATDPASIPFAIPAGAFLQTGILAVVDPAMGGGTLLTRDGKAGIDTDAFVSTGTFLLALSQLSGTSFPGFQPGSPGYEIVTNGTVPANGVLVQMCVVDPGDGSFDRLRLGHLLSGGGTELLEPADATICNAAGSSAGSGSLGWLPDWARSIGRLATGAVRKVFVPQPLYADYFAEKGLGGLAKSFSPFAPVDPVSLTPTQATIEAGETVNLTATLFGTATDAVVAWTTSNAAIATVAGTPPDAEQKSIGTVTGVAAGSVTITVTYTVTYPSGTVEDLTASATITVLPRIRELTVQMENLTPHEIRVTDGGAFSCQLKSGIAGAVTCTPKPWYEVGSTVTLTATAWSTGGATLPLTAGHHIKILGVGCDKLWPDNNEPSAFCTFVMPNGTPSISFTLTN